MAPEVRLATERDLSAILNVQIASPEAAQWDEESYRRALGDPAQQLFVAIEAAEVAGFLLARVLPDGAEILNFAVAPAVRRRGLGAALLDRFLRENPVETWAEVRESNRAALELYRSRKLDSIGRRRGYYHSPVEDALLLRRLAPN